MSDSADVDPAEGSNVHGEVAAAADSESEMSEVIDEPRPKKRRKVEPGKKSEAAATKSSSKTTKASSPPTADEAEIKRLQGWLIKCGIRKLWHKELAPYDTAKMKIAHLKEILSDAGMTGRYSNDKAMAIKERRELAADVEALTQGDAKWGKDGGEQDDGQTSRRRPIRNRVRRVKDNDDEEGESGSSDQDSDESTKKRPADRFVDFGDDDDDDDENGSSS